MKKSFDLGNKDKFTVGELLNVTGKTYSGLRMIISRLGIKLQEIPRGKRKIYYLLLNDAVELLRHLDIECMREL